jgi:hypothetical protein
MFGFVFIVVSINGGDGFSGDRTSPPLIETDGDVFRAAIASLIALYGWSMSWDWSERNFQGFGAPAQIVTDQPLRCNRRDNQRRLGSQTNSVAISAAIAATVSAINPCLSQLAFSLATILYR